MQLQRCRTSEADEPVVDDCGLMKEDQLLVLQSLDTHYE